MIKPFILPKKLAIIDISRVTYVSYPKHVSYSDQNGLHEHWEFDVKFEYTAAIVDLKFTYKYKWVQDEYHTEGLEARETGIDGKKKAEKACKVDHYAILSELIGL